MNTSPDNRRFASRVRGLDRSWSRSTHFTLRRRTHHALLFALAAQEGTRG